MRVRTYCFSRVFNEAARDLDSQPSPRTNHVEACRPRECLTDPMVAARRRPPGSRPQKDANRAA
jgi:hypothetical protein